MKHIAPQYSFDLGPAEPFKLITDSTQDGDQVSARQTQAEADRQAAAVRQPDLIQTEERRP